MKSKTVAALLAFFLGDFGIHRFYLGDTGIGLAFLIPSLFGLLTWFIGIGWVILILVWIASCVDFIIILCTDFDAKYNKQSYSQQSYVPQNYTPQSQYYAQPQTNQQSQQLASKSDKSKTEQLIEFKKLLDQGILTQEEFDKEKQKILRM